MRKNVRRSIAVVLAIVMMITMMPAGAATKKVKAATTGIAVESRTQEQIKQFVKEHPADLNQKIGYSENPNLEAPYEIGSLDDTTTKSALNMLNQVRYIAGIDADLTINDEQQEKAQAASLIIAVNGELSHKPTKPTGMSDELYNLCYSGAQSTNLHYNGAATIFPNGAKDYSLNDGIINGWMADEDASNIDRVGHRRWCLNPSMKTTGFGTVEKQVQDDVWYWNYGYSAMYSFDASRTDTSYKQVAWPAQNTPMTYFNKKYPWSISMGEQVSDTVSVTLTRKSDEKKWNFSKSKADGDFYINNINYGQTGCIIFRPTQDDDWGTTIGDDESYTVEINDYNAAGDDVSYDVNFFDLYAVESVSLDQSEIALNEGDTSTLKTTITPDNATNKAVTWESSDKKVATVNSSGKVTAVSKGTAKITVTTESGKKTATCKVTVKKPLTKSMIQEITTQDYTGKAICPSVAVMDGDTTLENGSDYKVSYESNTELGTAKVTVTGQGLYTGEITTNFKIQGRDVANVTIEDIDNQIYTGEKIEPELVVKDGTKTLDDTDYTVEYSNNVNKGTATAKITGIGNYRETKTKSFSIVAKNISDFTVEDIGKQMYTGSAVKPKVTVKDGTYTLAENTDYTLSYDNNTDMGTATVTITGAGNYQGIINKDFKIVKDIHNLEVAKIEDHTYTGETIHPKVEIKDGEYTLVENTDYQVSYGDNTNVGKGTVEITGLGKYDGTINKEFNITAKNVSEFTVESIDNQTYTGNEIKPTITVKDGDKELTYEKDYEVEYLDNTDAGTARVEIQGIGNYAGTKTIEFVIESKSLDQVVLNPIESQEYAGKQLTPGVEIKDGEKTLVEETDYIVTYSNNVNVGTAAVQIEGIGNYQGTINSSFVINEKSLDNVTIQKIEAQTWTGSSIEPNVIIMNGDVLLVKDTDYTLSYDNNTAIGKASVTITGTGNYQGTITKEFTITPKPLDETAIADIEAQPYTGEEIKPAVEVKDGTTELVEGTDYTVSYANNINAGQGKITIAFKGNYSGTVEKTFTITPKEVNDFTIGDLKNQEYTGNELKPEITLEGQTNFTDKDYNVTYKDNVNVGTATVEVALTGNYTGSTTTTFEITPRAITKATISAIADQMNTGAPLKPALVIRDGNRTLTEGKDYTLTYSNNINVGQGKVEVKGIGNYNGTSTVTFTIKAKPVVIQKNKTYKVGNAYYKVTSVTNNNMTATYTKPTSNNLKSVSIPEKVTILGKKVTVTAVADNAFKNNKKLKSVTISAKIKTVGKNAFYNCKNLKKITVKSSVLKTVGKNAIKNINKKAKIKVPKKKLKAYKKLFSKKTGFKKTMKITK